jgi:hypothetical protein
MSKSDVLIVWSRDDGAMRLAARCGLCGGQGRLFLTSVEADDCEHCEGCGWFGIDPERPVMADPGSVERIAMLSVRYAAGVPLWNAADRPVDERTARRFAQQTLFDLTGRMTHEPAVSEYGELSLAP